MPKKNLSHEEIWDDSALVSSWNEALAEYKKYHSLAVKGEKVDLIVDQAEKGQLDTQAPTVDQGEPMIEPGLQPNGEVRSEVAGTTEALPVAQTGPPQTGSVAMPQALLGAVQDEGMKNLIMSWYYAGYYTGLYEGKQHASTSMHPQG